MLLGYRSVIWDCISLLVRCCFPTITAPLSRKILGNGNKVLQIVNTTTSAYTSVCRVFYCDWLYRCFCDLFALFVFAWFWFVWLNLIVVGYHFCFLFQSIPAAVLIGLACLLCCGAGIDLPMFTNGLNVILQQQHCAEAYPSCRNQWKFFPLNHFWGEIGYAGRVKKICKQ